MSVNLSELSSLYTTVFGIVEPKRPAPPIDVRFYPYVGINHTIRVRDGKVFVRISELCRDMPADAQKALAYILVAKLLRKKVPNEARDIYGDYVRGHEIRERAVANKREKGRKMISTSKGATYDLDEIFDRVNRVYFQDAIKRPVLTWSTRRTFRILGHHDAAHETIVISRSLDDPRVPKFIVEYIVFHEMLHIYHPMEIVNGRRIHHSPAFRRNERKFRHYDAAELWIENNIRAIKRRATAKTR